jgi:hypothetical protein
VAEASREAMSRGAVTVAGERALSCAAAQ